MSGYLNLHVTGTQDTRYKVKLNLKLHVTEKGNFGYQVKYNLRLSVTVTQAIVSQKVINYSNYIVGLQFSDKVDYCFAMLTDF